VINYLNYNVGFYSSRKRGRGCVATIPRADTDSQASPFGFSAIINPYSAFFSQDDRPTKEASNARKRLLEAFAEYDALSKRIRNLPCPSGPGSSQDRVQMAVLTRANLFLQKNMFPLQVSLSLCSCVCMTDVRCTPVALKTKTSGRRLSITPDRCTDHRRRF